MWAFNGDRYTVKVPSAGTGGAFALMEAVIPPLSGPPLPIHHKEDEAFYIVDGELEVVDEDRTVNAGPGAFVWLPRGGRHGFRNISDKHTKILMFFLDVYGIEWAALSALV
ncbi:cupin domain-containing protein [Micromonospora sp. NPDC049230]|uniref:cupin domain-containing protein n=1 Tax=Micromonospora sp. NPDC049230 TaxID=3155502 RepID=UPI003400956D